MGVFDIALEKGSRTPMTGVQTGTTADWVHSDAL